MDTRKIHEHQHHALQEGFVHRPDDRAYLAMGNALLFPGYGSVEDDALQRVHHAAQGTGRTPHMRLQMETAEKFAERFGPHAAFEAKHKQGGYDQAEEPGAACLRFPQRGFRGAVAAIHRLEVAMHTTFRKSGALCKS